MKSLSTTPVLVLNRNWVPINIRTLEKAIKSVVAGKAKIIDTDDPNLFPYSWEEWCELDANSSNFIQSVKIKVKLPEVILLTKCSKVYNREVKLTRKNIFFRDRHLCGYCGKKVTPISGNIDHIIPKSKGGKNTWENVITACIKCNSKKSNHTLKECGKKLLTNPLKPSWHPLSPRIKRNSPKSWKKFLPNNAIVLDDYV